MPDSHGVELGRQEKRSDTVSTALLIVSMKKRNRLAKIPEHTLL